MQTLRRLIPLLAVGLLASAPAQTPPSGPAALYQKLPDVVDAEHRDLLERGDFDQARQRCEAAINSSALVSEQGILAGPYLCLGEALYGLRNYNAAALAFGNSIDQLERSVGVFDPRLIQPLEGLGKTLMKLGQLDAAEDALVTAKDLTHRNFGIYNLVQSSIVNRLTKTYYDRGDLPDASREQGFLLHANEENFGEAPQLLPAIRRMAKWNERIGRYDLARNNYRRALTIMQRAYGPDDLRLVGPLRDFARSYTNTPRGGTRVMSRAGANALMEIIGLYERQEFTDSVDVAQAWGELGDWYVIGGRRNAARKAYNEAGKILQSADAGDDNSVDLFSRPVEIEYEDVPIGLRSSRVRDLPDGIAILEFEFTVTEEGRVADLSVVRDDLNYTRFALEVGQRVKASRYRPRIVDGQPVATTGVRKTLRYDLTSRLPPPNVSAESAETDGPAESDSGPEPGTGEDPAMPETTSAAGDESNTDMDKSQEEPESDERR